MSRLRLRLRLMPSQSLADFPCTWFGALPPGEDMVGWGNGGVQYHAPAWERGSRRIAQKGNEGP